MPLIYLLALALLIYTPSVKAGSQECVAKDGIRTCKICDTDGNSCLTYKQQQGQVLITVENMSSAPNSYYLDLMLKNLKPATPIPDAFTLRGKGTKREFVLLPETPRASYSYNINYKTSFGRFDAKHNDNYVYALPYEPGTIETVTQGNFSNGSHKNKNAVDFALKEGTPVYAARDGEVVDVKQDSTEGGDSKQYYNSANHIYIEHDDGTIAAYVHLQPNGSFVKEGEKVKRGQKIGLSGKTGMISGPHLHFEVRASNKNAQTITFPTQFDSIEGLIKTPTKGQKLTAR